LPTISQQRRELPLARFTAQPRVYYPGIELVADAELSADNDPYLLEHELDGELLFPAVLGIEAMAQAAAALVVAEGQPVLERAEFLRPIVVPRDGSLTIRLAALNRAGAVDVVIRCGDTDFQADHFRATLRWGASLPADERPDQAAADLPAVVLDPGRDLYGGILFQGKRFQRVVGYRSLTATSCVAEISTTPAASWFGGFLPSGLVLGDPGARDAFMHAIQCCVPHATLLPAAADRIYLGTPRDAAGTAASRGAAGTAVLTATERFRDGDSYTYDLDVRAADGELIERWEGLRLRAVRKQSGRGPWIPALLGPFLEREAPAAPGQALRCVVEPDAAGKPLSRDARRKQTKLALSRLLGRRTVVRYRADGKPEVPGEMSVSASHGAGLTFVTGLKGQVGCDVELITDRTEADWQLLLSAEQLTLAGLIRLECGEDLSVSATRVWGAVECLNKLGRPASGPIVLARCRSDGWAVLDAGDARLATFHTRVRNEATAVSASPGSVISGQPSADHAVIFTILTEGGG
jgi:enediyne polyketide synthase